jgi:hypothetical protein
VELLEQENILERWRKDDPDDQVYLCVLGDFVDRSTTGGLLFEFLLELKFREGFERRVIVVPGNHELFIDQHVSSSRNITALTANRWKNLVGFCEEMIAWRHLDADRSSLNDSYVQEMISLCPTWFDPEAAGLDSTQAQLFRARAGLWMTFFATFKSLPKTILGEKGLFAAHGGFPVSSRFTGLDTQTGAVGSTALCGSEGLIHLNYEEIVQVAWNDFDANSDSVAQPLSVNTTRGQGFFFGDRVFDRFGAITGSTLMIRGHQSIQGAGTDVVTPNEPNMRYSPSWKSKRIFTLVGSDKGWFSTLDLSIDKPSPNDVKLRKLKNP